MSYTLRGRLESRLASALPALAAACALAAALAEWWPLELAGLMLALGLVLDVQLYDRLLAYQPGWLALPLGLLELGGVTGLALALGIGAPLGGAVAFYAGAWLAAQALAHAGFPLWRLSYAEDGGELGPRAARTVAAVVLVVFAAAGGAAWAMRLPTVHLRAGVHRGPLVIDRAERLVGEPGAIVRGGIVVRADDVTIRDVAVVGGVYGIDVDEAERVVLDGVSVTGAVEDGIHVRRSEVTIRGCSVAAPAGRYAQGIDISFTGDLRPSTISGCTVVGGLEGILVDAAQAAVTDNRVRATVLRGIAMTEMSMGMIERNEVVGALGVGIFCGDHSTCMIERNVVADTRPDSASGDLTRAGFGILVHYGSEAELDRNELVASPGGVAAVLDSRLVRR
jgi:nitrous oxidase accessory protein NosD